MGVRLVLSPRGVASGEAEYEFDQDRILFGRGGGTDVRLPDPSASVRHATLKVEGGRYLLVDHGSTNGTRVNGQLLVPERPKLLRDGDTFAMGIFVVRYSAGIAVREPSTRERTASLARRLARLASPAMTSTPPRLVVLNGPAQGKVLEVPEPPARLVIGRAETAELAIPDVDASREHCELLVSAEGVSVRDLGSKNGTTLNDRPLREARLRDRDQLTIGETVIAFEDPSESALLALESAPDVVLPAEPAPPPSVPVALPPEPAREPEAVVTPVALRAPGLAGVELFVVLLALLVLAVSLAGLYFLVGGG